jgi:hypothetical protein
MAEEAKEQLNIFEVETGLNINKRLQKRRAASPSKTSTTVTGTTQSSRKKERKR